MSKLDCSVVFMTDPIIDNKKYGVERDDAEGNSRKAANSIFNAIDSVCKNAIMLESISEYTDNILKYKKWIMFSTRYGKASPSSKALIPAICEANGIEYVGADSYTHMICNDKFMSKKYVQEFDLKTAQSVLIRDANDISQTNLVSYLRFPVIVKPNYGGGSSGISSANVKYSFEQAVEYIRFLQSFHRQPILVEEYIPGYEIEVIMFGNKKGVTLFDQVQILLNNQAYFTSDIFDLQSKKIDDSASTMQYCSLLNSTDIENMHKLFLSFPKVEFMRVDCRIYNGHAYVIELSPDCYLGEDGGVYMAFKHQDISFPDMFYHMIRNSLD